MKNERVILLLWLLAINGASLLYADDAPRVLHIGMVTSDTVEVTVQAGYVEYGKQVPLNDRGRGEYVKSLSGGVLKVRCKAIISELTGRME